MAEGVDYSWSRPGGAALAAAGKSFALRYLYPGGGKGLTAAEVNDLHAHGISVFGIFESSATRALDGNAAGVADAQIAQGQLGACGLPADQIIYFGVDFDAVDGQMPVIDDYLRGAATILGQGRVGVYGSYRVTTHCRASGSAPHAFQTYAWSHGQVDGGASFYQYNNGQNVNGSVDLVRSLNNSELSQTGSLTPLGEDMPLTQDDLLAIWTFKLNNMLPNGQVGPVSARASDWLTAAASEATAIVRDTADAARDAAQTDQLRADLGTVHQAILDLPKPSAVAGGDNTALLAAVADLKALVQGLPKPPTSFVAVP